MSGKFFIDTNILIYSFDEDSPGKRDTARGLIAEALTSSRGIISSQVIQEFLNAATRKFRIPLITKDARAYLDRVLEPLCRVYASPELYHSALEIMDRWRYSFYDSLIISAALEAGCRVLYTEDLQHLQTIRGLTIRNPFIAA